MTANKLGFVNFRLTTLSSRIIHCIIFYIKTRLSEKQSSAISALSNFVSVVSKRKDFVVKIRIKGKILGS